MNFNKFIRLTCLYQGIPLACFCGITVLLTPVASAPPTPSQVEIAGKQIKSYNEWFNADWTDDDRPYQRIRVSVEQGATNGQKAIAMMKTYESQTSKNPNDFQAHFGYYYAAYWAAIASDGLSDYDGQQRLGNLSDSIINQPHPHTYNYARLVFLCQSYCWPDPDMNALATRLVSHDPKDRDVKFYAASVLAASPLSSDRTQAVAYARDNIQRYPKKPSSYSLLGYVYYHSWLKSKKPEDASEAIVAYNHYLSIAPPGDNLRKQAEFIVARLQKG